MLHLVRTPCAPGKPRKDQHRLGREDLLRDDVRDVRAEHPRSARADARRRRLRSGARHRGDHCQPLAARLYLQLQHARRSGGVVAGDAGRPRARRRPRAVRANLDRQRRRRRQLAHRRGDRHGVPRRQRGAGVAIERVRLADAEVGGMIAGAVALTGALILASLTVAGGTGAASTADRQAASPVVAVAGCAASSAEPHIWILSNATARVESDRPGLTVAEKAQLASQPLGRDTYRLIGVADFVDAGTAARSACAARSCRRPDEHDGACWSAATRWRSRVCYIAGPPPADQSHVGRGSRGLSVRAWAGRAGRAG